VSAAPAGALWPLVRALRALGLPATAVEGRWSLRLGPQIPALSLAALAGPPVPVEQDPHRYRPVVELCRLALAGHPPPLRPVLRSAALAQTAALQAGDPLGAGGRPLRLGPRLLVLPLVQLGGGQLDATPLLHLARTTLPEALEAWAAGRPRLAEDDPARLLLDPPGPGALRVGARLRRLPIDDEDALLHAALTTATAPERGPGSGLLHVHAGPLSVRPLRRAAPDLLRRALQAAELEEDLHDYNHALSTWAEADPLGRAWPALRRVQGPAGAPLGVSAWPRAAAALPAADLLDLELGDGAVVRVWTDAVLDVLNDAGQPIPGTWPPRFAVPGPFPAAAEARARAQAIPAD
jgi:hypothetical protein